MTSLTPGGYVKSSVVLHPDQVARLDRMAAERHLSKSVIIRAALDEKLDRIEAGGPLIEGRPEGTEKAERSV
jgi:predicted transcriptional regulator